MEFIMSRHRYKEQGERPIKITLLLGVSVCITNPTFIHIISGRYPGTNWQQLISSGIYEEVYKVVVYILKLELMLSPGFPGISVLAL